MQAALKDIFIDIAERDIVESLIYNYKRKIALYRFIDMKMREKYKMNFDEFQRNNIVAKKEFSWDVESDAMKWEHSLAGINYLTKKLKQLQAYAYS